MLGEMRADFPKLRSRADAMRALVLAAGMGERLRPLTDVTPKPMLELGGRPLIHYPLAMLQRGGITEVAINLHHLASIIQRGLGDGSPWAYASRTRPNRYCSAPAARSTGCAIFSATTPS